MTTDACGCESVCSLPSDELEKRIASVRAELVPLIRRRERLADGIAWVFAGGDEMRTRLDEFVAFERQCCSGLTFAVEPTDEDGLRVTVRGDGAGEFEALAEERARGGGNLARAAKAGGIGLAASLVLCCGLPVAVASVAGIAIAAPLSRLDTPFGIAAATALIAIPTWLVLGRRSRCDAGC